MVNAMRWLLTIVLVILVGKETGFFTALTIAMIAIAIEFILAVLFDLLKAVNRNSANSGCRRCADD